MPADLPSFDRPPLTEVFLALQQEPLAGLLTPQLGEFLLSRRPTWVSLPDAPVIGQTREPVDEAPEWILPGTLEIDIRTGVRLRASNAERDRMLQVENGWLALNWIGGADRPYPRYETLRAEFDEHYRAWTAFLAAHLLGQSRPNLWEVGYVNVFPRGELWRSPDDWPRVLPGVFQRGPGTLGVLQTQSGRWAYLIERSVARLQIIVEHALRGSPEPRECLVLRLVARGPIANGSYAAAARGFDLGHEKIVTTFAALLSDDARRALGLRA